MINAKQIVIKPITSKTANAVIKKLHYSGKVVPNSQLHFGVFLDNRLEGAMSFGPSMDKSKVINLVKNTMWNGFIELNRMAFSERLPRNSESRAMAVAFKIIKKHYPHIEWVISYSDGTQCGDGVIYRAAGFVLTAITENKTILMFPDGTKISDLTLNAHWNTPAVLELCKRLGVSVKNRTITEWRNLGAKPIAGYQFRYIYFLNKTVSHRLAVPVIPFSKISDMGASMYKGKKITRVKEQELENPSNLGGATPTHTLHNSEVTA